MHFLTQCSHDLSLEVEPGHHGLLWRTSYLLSIHEKKGVISIYLCKIIFVVSLGHLQITKDFMVHPFHFFGS